MKKHLVGLMLVIALFAVASLAVSSAQNSNGNQNGNTNANSNSNSSTDPGDPNVKVWVNKTSHIYHCPGARSYGTTKNGEYMTQKQAQDAGNRAAAGKVCKASS
jgi:hypothetical protein